MSQFKTLNILLCTFIITHINIVCANLMVNPSLQNNAATVQRNITHNITTENTPNTVSQSEWQNIQAQIRSNEYKAYRTESSGFKSANPAQGWQIDYQLDGTTTLSPYSTKGEYDYHISLRLNSVAYQSTNNDSEYVENGFVFDQPIALSFENNRLNYQWDDNITEYWINSEQKLEQWFEIKRPPHSDKRATQRGPLEIRMALDTDLNVSLNNNRLLLGQITYDKLKVWDVNGQIIPAELALKNDHLSILLDDNNATYPLTVDPSFIQEAYVKSFNTDIDDQFGRSVSISGNTMVIGAPSEDSSTTGINGDGTSNVTSNSGAAYVFVRTGSTWSQQAYLKASNAQADDNFGQSVSISADTIVIGATGEDSNAVGVNNNQLNNSASTSGAAYVFVRTGSTWSQQAYLKASNTESNDEFGTAVSISGDTVVVGAINERSSSTGVNGIEANNTALSAGAAYVFVRSGTNWTQEAYLKASNTETNDQFGRAVAVTNDTIIVSATGEDSNAVGINGDQANNSRSDSGAAYVFVRATGMWSQQAYLKASNTDANDVFGSSVSISGDTVVVSAVSEDSDATGVNGDENNNLRSGSGAAYAFVRSGTDWAQQAYLKASNGTSRFGESSSISNNTVVIGASGNLGGGYVFVRSGSTWTQQSRVLASNTENNDLFGGAVSISGDTVVVGAIGEDSNATGVNGNQADNSASNSGAAYVYEVAYFIGGSVSGLAAGNSVTLQNNAGDDLIVSDNGAFAFASTLFDGSDYEVTVLSNPTGPNQSCSITNGSGTIAGVDITNVMMNCVTNTHTVGGTISGLASGNTVTLQNNNGDDLVSLSNGPFTFSAQDDGSNYEVSVLSQPTTPNQICTVSSGVNTLAGADVTDVSVTCVIQQYSIGGFVTGLAPDNTLTLQNNGGDNALISSNGIFTFNNPLNDESTYSVTVLSDPTTPNQVCSITNGNGTLAGTNIMNVAVSCVTDTHTVGGSISGLAAGNTITLQNNGGDDQINLSNGTFVFSAQDDGSSYSVTVLNQPTTPSQTCTVASGSGNLTGADVTDVSVTCVNDTFSIGGSVSGLAAGNSLTLQNNGADSAIVSSNGAFVFATALADESTYSVTVLSNPTTPNQICSITNGNGTLAGQNIMDIIVTCVTNTHTVGGSISGLATGNTITLQNNGGDDQINLGNGPFVFSAQDDGSTYAVTVLNQPTAPNQTCTVSSGSGVLIGNNVTNVSVTCVTDTFSISGSVAGLTSGNSVILQNNAGDDITVSNNGGFTFTTALDDESSYDVTILSSPTTPNQTCSVTNGNGTLAGTNVTNVVIDCVTDTHTVSGSVSGLADGNNVILQNNGGDSQIVSVNGPFMFSAQDDGTNYAVTVLINPVTPNQQCSVTNGSGTLAGTNVTTVSVTCVTETYTVAGLVSGLAAGNSVTVQNNGGDDQVVSANGAFTFSAQNDGSNYSVTVLNQPSTPNQNCVVTSGSGALAGADVDNVVIDCVTDTHTVIGSVTGLAQASSVTLQNNGADDLVVSANGVFIFSAQDDGSEYAITVSSQPFNQLCTVSNGTGTIAGTNVTNVTVNCINETLTIGGSVSGLEQGNEVILQNNGTDDLTVSSNSAFVFSTALLDGESYDVTVLTQPDTPNQVCIISNSSGTLSGDNVTDVLVTCQTEPTVIADAYEVNEDTLLSATDVDGTTTVDTNDNSVLVNDAEGLFVVTPGTFTANGIGGSITINADGTFNYMPPNDLFGEATFNYEVSDGILAVDAQLSINVLPVNDAPSFTISGDVEFDIFNFTTNPVDFNDFIVDFDLGPDNESDQQINQYDVVIRSDSNAILNTISMSNAGVLSLDFSTNIGVALIDITLQDDAGIALGGNDTSVTQSFFIAFTNDIIFMNGFESVDELLILSHLNQLQAITTEFNYPIYDENSDLIEFYGALFYLGGAYDSQSKLETLNYWLREVLMHNAPFADYDGDGIENYIDKQPFKE